MALEGEGGEALVEDVEALGLATIALRLKALANLKRRAKNAGCDGAYLLVHYELLGIYLGHGDSKRVHRVRAVIDQLSPIVIAKLARKEAAERRQKKDPIP